MRSHEANLVKNQIFRSTNLGTPKPALSSPPNRMGRMVVAGITSLWVIPLSIMVNRIVSERYMDEIFHIPQAQQYCRGDFKTWDPMITTPPGLYYLTLVYVASTYPGMRFINAATSLSDLCSVAIFRSINGVLAIICSIIVYELIIHLKPTIGERRAILFAVILSLYPVNWFFTFLYYTDVASLTAVLAMYLASLKRHYWISAMLGALATLLRQTNIVWMLFVAAIGAISYAEDRYRKDYGQRNENNIVVEKKNIMTNKKIIPTGLSLRRHRTSNATKSTNISISVANECHHPGCLDEIMDIVLKLWRLKWRVLISFAPFVIVLTAFVTFVIRNGSIVLGAKGAHVVSPHFAQMLYFGFVAAAASAPMHFSLSQATILYRSLRRSNFFQVSIALLVGFIWVHFFSIAHPYLLADNRHYPFYLWRKVIQAHWTMKYLLVPLYVYSWFSIISILGKAHKKIWVLLFFLVCGLVLIPAPLIEFRYYTIPFYFFILHSKIDDNNAWLIMGVLYIAVNIFTMSMFLFRPFHWGHEPGIQRFIW